VDIAVVSLFPEMLAPFTELGVVGRAVQRGLVRMESIDPRSYATDAHGTVDDRPYGGGAGDAAAGRALCNRDSGCTEPDAGRKSGDLSDAPGAQI
jgi:tRNA (guanine-N1)-methyltransferase